MFHASFFAVRKKRDELLNKVITNIKSFFQKRFEYAALRRKGKIAEKIHHAQQTAVLKLIGC